MKGNKKLLVVAVLLLLIAVSYGTYAIYKSQASANATVNTAAWVIEVNGDDIVANNTFTLGNITWASPEYGRNGKIAPGDHGTVNIVIDADGSEVDVGYEISIDTASIENHQFSVAAADPTNAPLTGVIPYASGEGNMTKTIAVEVVWEGIDTASANEEDIDFSAQQVVLPITVVATQNPNPAASSEQP